MAKICLLTPGQPSTNPRLVKEADALVEAGHEVEVICAHWADWADDTDKEMLRSRRFTCTYVGGHSTGAIGRFAWTRLRYKVGRTLAPRLSLAMIRHWALCRVTPELTQAAMACKADLYIAHNLGALPAAVLAARRHHAKVGFDAEDFHSGMAERHSALSFEGRLIEQIERQYLPICDYVTAASPLIANAYKAKYGIVEPITILNVFPLSQRPREFRSSRNEGPLTLYWFSQTIGGDRGLEDVIKVMGQGSGTSLHLRGSWQPGYQKQLLLFAKSVGVEPERVVSHSPGSPDEMVHLAASLDIGLALEQPDILNRDICLTNKIFTYLLAGNAILATGTQGQRPILQELAPAGYYYKPGKMDELAAILKQWKEDRTSLENARRLAWEWGTRKYNWDIEKSKFLDIVSGVLANRFKLTW